MLDVININFKYTPHVSFLNLLSTFFDIFLNTLVSWINFRHDDGLSEKLFWFRGTFPHLFEHTIQLNITWTMAKADDNMWKGAQTICMYFQSYPF